MPPRAAARRPDTSKRRACCDPISSRSTTDDALSLARRLENIQGTMHECDFKAPAVENVRDDASTRARTMRTHASDNFFYTRSTSARERLTEERALRVSTRSLMSFNAR